MPSLTINDPKTNASTEFFYPDSGAPNREVYTTLVLLHGICFHNAVFQRILPLATSKGLRLVSPNRRDYPGTTLYSPGELKALYDGGVDEIASFIQTRGRELALFLDGLIDALSLPRPTADGSDGGLGILGWSMGSIFLVGTVASVASLPSQAQSRLQSYLRRFIVFDPSNHAVGIPNLPRTFASGFGEGNPQPEQLAEFVRWLSSYFAHGDLSTRDVENLEFKSPDVTKKSLIPSLPAENLNSLVDYGPVRRSERMLFKAPAFLFNQMRQVLFDPETRSMWPNLDIWWLYSDSSPGMTIHAAWEIEKLAKASKAPTVQFLAIKDAYHLVFWDEPEKALEAFDHCLRH